MVIRYSYFFIVIIYLLGCNETYEPYIIHAYNKTKTSEPIKRFSAQDDIPELSEEWKKELEKIKALEKQEILANNIKLLGIEDRAGLWRLFMSIPPKQQPYFLQDIMSFSKDEQAALLDIILYLERQDEKLMEAALSGNAIYLPIFEQIKLSNMLQSLKISDQTLLAKFEARLNYPM